MSRTTCRRTPAQAQKTRQKTQKHQEKTRAPEVIDRAFAGFSPDVEDHARAVDAMVVFAVFLAIPVALAGVVAVVFLLEQLVFADVQMAALAGSVAPAGWSA